MVVKNRNASSLLGTREPDCFDIVGFQTYTLEMSESIQSVSAYFVSEPSFCIADLCMASNQPTKRSSEDVADNQLSGAPRCKLCKHDFNDEVSVFQGQTLSWKYCREHGKLKRSMSFLCGDT